MLRKILSFVTVLVLIGYAFEKGYDKGYEIRDNKYPDDYY